MSKSLFLPADLQAEEEKGMAKGAVDFLIRYAGDSPDREGLKETPKRYVKFLDEFFNPEPFEFTMFDSEGHDEMVLVSNIPFYSLCEHHTLPFFGVAHIAYIPNGRIVGLSKIPRLLDKRSRTFQNQERITAQVAEDLEIYLNPKGVAVILKARHMCMEMRGIKKQGSETTTSAMRGAFKDDFNCRQEFLNLIK